MGDEEVISTYRSTLDGTLIDLHNKWQDLNVSRKSQYIVKESSRAGVASIVGAIVGGILGGPPGAIAGVLFGGAGSCAFSWANRWKDSAPMNMLSMTLGCLEFIIFVFEYYTFRFSSIKWMFLKWMIKMDVFGILSKSNFLDTEIPWESSYENHVFLICIFCIYAIRTHGGIFRACRLFRPLPYRL